MKKIKLMLVLVLAISLTSTKINAQAQSTVCTCEGIVAVEGYPLEVFIAYESAYGCNNSCFGTNFYAGVWDSNCYTCGGYIWEAVPSGQLVESICPSTPCL